MRRLGAWYIYVMAGRFHVGTSGFSYPQWHGSFYPADLPADRMLHHHSCVLPSVELNNTFSRFPSAAQIARWREATPGHFRFAVKAQRLITYIRRLCHVGDAVRTQIERVEALHDRRGPLLFQFPPSLPCDHGAALAIMEADDEPTLESVGPLVSPRLHRSRYSTRAMQAWTRRIQAQLWAGKTVDAYFTHEDGAPAPVYAARPRTLAERL